MSRDEDGFLSRWSRRKQEARREPPPEPVAPEAAPVPDAEASPAEDAAAPEAVEMSAEEIAALPPVESIGPQTDITVFLRKGVPAALRKAALRRLWAADPAIRDYVNEAREYAYDWNVPGGVPGTGELLPTDDVPAMVAWIFGTHPPAEPPPEAAEASQDAAAAPDETAAAEPRPALEAPEAPATKSAENGPAGAISAEAEPLSPGKDAEMPRPRRHGGAAPV
ncbi:DUF3306 domain-containing protein [Salinarimonas soli]|uniref:DUF3306 domain-containing protein n=1 Tax=Salinarimonas soli TaxID=1638099 RepID=A0A5B2VFE0_9HYPH|nr:DUF3306 domain-containing protein [Salinarimonas soli]KAA2237160.1 DUF3306 domain-containing protein [Salinarimonas soli]